MDVRSLRLTRLWTEGHSGLWLEGRASQAQLVRMLHQLVRKIGQDFVRLKGFLPERNNMFYFRRKKTLQPNKGSARAQQTGATYGLDPATSRTADEFYEVSP